MILQYPNKRTKEQILLETNKLNVCSVFGNGKNKLIKGDNLRGLKTLLEDF